MPQYHCKGVEIRLCTWMLPIRSASLSKAVNSVAAITGSGTGFDSPHKFAAYSDAPASKTEDLHVCSAAGSKLEALEEKYFDKHVGLSFIDNESPFYLVRVTGLPSDHVESMKLNAERRFGDNFTQMPHCASNIDLSPGVSYGAQVTLKPLEIIINLSEKSFIEPLFGSSCYRYDICVHIFYNGELAHSRVIKFNPSLTQGYKQRLSFGGRRSEAHLEIPWMISTQIPNTGGHDNVGGDIEAAMSASQRWAKLSELLLTEADEWGRLENGSRSIVGNYLELLSKQAMPIELDGTALYGKEYGVIDVLVGYGYTSSPGVPVILTSPSRRLPRGMLNINVGKRSEGRVGSARNLSVDQVAPNSTTPNSIVATSTNLTKQRSKPMALRGTDKPRVIPVPPRPLPYELPKDIPQKRYRGPSPEPVKSQELSCKRIKQVKLQNAVVTDLAATPAMSTRSRAQDRQTPSLPVTQEILVHKKKVLTIATPQKIQDCAPSSTLTRPALDKPEVEQDAVKQSHGEVTIAPSGIGSPVVPLNDSAFKTPLKEKHTLPERRTVGSRELKQMLTSSLLGGVNAISDGSLRKTRRATWESRELAPAQVKRIYRASTAKQRNDRTRSRSTTASSRALRCDDPSSAVPQPVQKKIKLKLGLKTGAKQSQQHLPDIEMQKVVAPTNYTEARQGVDPKQSTLEVGVSRRASLAGPGFQPKFKGRLRREKIPNPQACTEALISGSSANAANAVGESKEKLDSGELPKYASEVQKSFEMQTSTANIQGADSPLLSDRQERAKRRLSRGKDKIPVPGTRATSIVKPWGPNILCKGSVLTYLSNEDLDSDAVNGQAYRTIVEEQDEHFETRGILLGTRYVVSRNK